MADEKYENFRSILDLQDRVFRAADEIEWRHQRIKYLVKCTNEGTYEKDAAEVRRLVDENRKHEEALAQWLEALRDTYKAAFPEREANKDESASNEDKCLSATELTDKIYQTVVEAVKATGERPYSLDEGCNRIAKTTQISTMLQWLVRRQQDSLESTSKSR